MGNEKYSSLRSILRAHSCLLRFRAVSSSVYAQLDGVLIVFGYDSKESLSRCQSTWLREVRGPLVVLSWSFRLAFMARSDCWDRWIAIACLRPKSY